MTDRQHIRLPDGSLSRRRYTAAEAMHVRAHAEAQAAAPVGVFIEPSAELERAKARAIAAEGGRS